MFTVSRFPDIKDEDAFGEFTAQLIEADITEFIMLDEATARQRTKKFDSTMQALIHLRQYRTMPGSLTFR